MPAAAEELKEERPSIGRDRNEVEIAMDLSKGDRSVSWAQALRRHAARRRSWTKDGGSAETSGRQVG